MTPWCTPVSMAKRQQFPCPPSRRTSSLKVENVVPGAEFALSCTVANYIFTARDVRTLALVFKKTALSLPLAPTVETRATELRFSSRCPGRNLVHGGLAIAAATVFLDRAAEEQSTFYTDCCCCRATESFFSNWYVSYELLLVLQ